MFPGLLLRGPGSFVVSAGVFALLALSSITLWCLTGTVLSRKLQGRTGALISNSVLAALLVLTALSVALG
jgi:threonine/homoserine/homoserine lactone efflux protein